MTRIFSLPRVTAISAAIATALSTPAMAGGLSVNEQSASGMGTAYAGRASSALDASTVFGNPAGMSRLGAQASAGFAFIDANIDIKNATGDAPGTNKGDMVPFKTIPFGYYVNPLNEDWHFGIGIYAPFGGDADYESTFQGRYKGTTTQIQVVTVQPTLSYRINDRVSVGVGPTISRIDGTLGFNLDTSALGGGDAEVESSGHDYGVGYNIGVIADITDATTVGLTYRSKTEFNLRGETKARGLPPAGAGLGLINGDYRGKLDFTAPETAEFSVSHRLDDQWTLHGGAVWTRWDRLNRIVIDNSGAVGALEQLQEEVQWRNTWAYALGASYQINPDWVVRAGVALDEAPATNEFRSVRTPYGNRKVASLGAGWSPTQHLTIDVAYAYLRESDAGVNQPAELLRPGYSATYETEAHGVSAQFTYKY